MTMYEFIVPLIALAIAAIGIICIKILGHKLDKEDERQQRAPAE